MWDLEGDEGGVVSMNKVTPIIIFIFTQDNGLDSPMPLSVSSCSIIGCRSPSSLSNALFTLEKYFNVIMFSS